MKVLVIDIGGTHVKALVTDATEPRRFASGQHLTPDDLMTHVRDITRDWTYDVVSLGYPGPVGPDGPTDVAGNLGDGWVGYDFEAAFQRPVRIINDAVMQALGGYAGGRMLFLGLGTGLGSALVVDRVVVPLELGGLPYGSPDGSPDHARHGSGDDRDRADATMADRLGKRGLEAHGDAAWLESVHHAIDVLRRALLADYVLLGGGNAARVQPLPDGVRRGGNDDAFTGGFRLWEERVEPHDGPPPSHVWRVVH